jgi:hypothetical protein
MSKKIKKSQIKESEYVVDKDNYDDVKNDLKYDLKPDDVVKIVDDEDLTEESTKIEENTRAIITKRDLIKTIKENRNVK